MRFTNEAIRDARYIGDGKSRHIEWDKGTSASVTGLGVRVYAPKDGKSRKAYVLDYRCFDPEKGKRVKRLDVLGPFGEMTVTKARDTAKDWKEDIRNGRDPRKGRKEHEAVAVLTFDEAVTAFIEKYAKPRQRTAKETERTLRVNCAGWSKKSITAIAKADAYGLIEGYQAAGQDAKARVTLAWLKTMFKWLHKRDYIAADIMSALDIEFEKTVTERRYTDDEIKALWKGADTLPPQEGAYLKLLLLLCTRKSELAGMRASELDNRVKPTLWTVPHQRTKSRKSLKRERVYIVPLPALAQRILKGIPRTHDDLIFPGHRLTEPDADGNRERLPLVPGKNLQRRIQEASGVSDFKFHDLRDTIASWLKDEGHSPYERALCLNHSEGGLAATYAHGYPVELKRSLLDKWADHVEALVQPLGVSVLR